ncbi:MAG TPA: haloacid dehalogenase type II [Dongiaceae bacterium]|jgi:2-haloacid dehalogenase|nr:haloacid dehalogenase type II [Dongiaceae bacterium]
MSQGRSRTRRDFISLAATGVATAALTSSRAGGARASAGIKAIAFDGFTIIDARPVAARAEELFPGQGKALVQAWRAQQFSYAWLRTMGDRYRDFWRVTEDALDAAARAQGLALDAERRARLMRSYLELKAWPDAVPVLRHLTDAGIKLVFLSNFTAAMLDAAVKNSGLDGVFEDHLSTDLVQAYKPDPRAYAMAPRSFGLTREEIAFVAFAGWDVAGAKWFGYPTYWANRAGAPRDTLGATADAEGTDLSGLEAFVGLRT